MLDPETLLGLLSIIAANHARTNAVAPNRHARRVAARRLLGEIPTHSATGRSTAEVYQGFSRAEVRSAQRLGANAKAYLRAGGPVKPNRCNRSTGEQP